jgi:hypothetical protein
MNEWQPARWRQVHKRNGNVATENLIKFRSMVLKVRPIDINPKDVIQRNLAEKCDAEKFYEVKDLDGCICEHEILTD